MPNKRVDRLKDDTTRAAGQEWQAALGLTNMTTNEWDYAVHLQMDKGMSDVDTRQEILRNRK